MWRFVFVLSLLFFSSQLWSQEGPDTSQVPDFSGQLLYLVDQMDPTLSDQQRPLLIGILTLYDGQLETLEAGQQKLSDDFAVERKARDQAAFLGELEAAGVGVAVGVVLVLGVELIFRLRIP